MSLRDVEWVPKVVGEDARKLLEALVLAFELSLLSNLVGDVVHDASDADDLTARVSPGNLAHGNVGILHRQGVKHVVFRVDNRFASVQNVHIFLVELSRDGLVREKFHGCFSNVLLVLVCSFTHARVACRVVFEEEKHWQVFEQRIEHRTVSLECCTLAGAVDDSPNVIRERPEPGLALVEQNHVVRATLVGCCCLFLTEIRAEHHEWQVSVE